MSFPRARQKLSLLKGDEIGSGGFGIVYHATEINSGRAVALKKSRVSLKVKRSLLQHEARVLKLLSGHPAIPDIFGYGRVEHFELLSMQLLDRNLGDVVRNSGPISLAVTLGLTDQMLDALNHVHGHGLVHRDIKPDNVVLRAPGSWQLCLIDFGLVYRPALTTGNKLPRCGSEGPNSLFGTLLYASINAHKGIDLTFRDDLESLAYTLISLLQGSLPWSPYANHGSIRGRLRQVQEQKKSYTGQRLALGIPPEFGALVDYARLLSFDTLPSYTEWRQRFKRCSSQCPSNSDVATKAIHAVQTSRTPPSQPPPPPIKTGQLILAQVLTATTIEGYSAQAGHECSYIPDPSLTSPEWSTPPRPGVVISVGWSDRWKLYHFTVVAISRRQPEFNPLDFPKVPIVGQNSIDPGVSNAKIRVEPQWPFDDSYCYAFKDPETFYCLPSQSPISTTWETSRSDAILLNQKLRPYHDPFGYYPETISPIADIRHGVRMRRGNVKVYAQILPLFPDHMSASTSIDWFSDRAWFDECVQGTRRRDLDNGHWWTGAAFNSGYQDQSELSDSYFGSDYSLWDRQQERGKSLTLSSGGQEDEDVWSIEKLDEVILLG